MPFVEHILSTIAPHTCVGCDEEGPLICQGCLALCRRVPSRCYRCQQVSTDFRTCQTCRGSSPLYSVKPFAAYEDIPKALLHKVKYERLRSGAKTIAAHMAPGLAGLAQDTLITHVPTATSRVRQRGYDQAALIARELAILLDLDHVPLLTRYGQQRQVGKDRKERREQMKKLFASTKSLQQNKNILLIDDVLTTGATLEACARVLKDAGAQRVSAAVFAAA